MQVYTKHWVYDYIGLAWTGMYNCFDHFKDVQKNKFGVKNLDNLNDVPEFEDRDEAISFIKSNDELRAWKEIHPNMAREGDAVLFGVEGVTFHIGTYVDSGKQGIDKHKGVLHCDIKQGVVLTSMQAIRNAQTTITFMRLTTNA